MMLLTKVWSTLFSSLLQIVMVAKRKTVSKLASASKVVTKDDVVDEGMDAQIVPVEEETKELTEQDLVAARMKELKSMSAEQMKELVLSNGLEKGSKEVMIKSLLK